MCQLLESIYVKDGVFRNLEYHLQRMKQSTHDLFGEEIKGDFNTWIHPEEVPHLGIVKCRVLYDKDIESIEYAPYTPRQIRSLKIVGDNTVSYSYKFSNRSNLKALFDKREESDEILIIKNGHVTDTSYANLIFKKGDEWFTPESCLLNGTMRQYLLAQSKINSITIRLDDLREYESCKLINSMLGMDAPEISIQSIVLAQ